MIPASEAEVGKFYRTSRSTPGPRVYYTMLTDGQVRRVERRLGSQPYDSLTTTEINVLKGARLALRGGGRLAWRYIRCRGDDEPIELREYAFIPADYELREIERPPGYGRKRRQCIDGEEING